MPRSAPCAGEWVAEEPMEQPSPPNSPLMPTNKQRLPTSPLLNTTTSISSSSSKQASNSSSKQQTGKQAPGSLLSASEPRTSSKVSISFPKQEILDVCFPQKVLPGGADTGSSSMVVMRGLLWVQQDRIFCRWKER